MELDAMTLVFWMLSFKPAFSLSSFTFIKRLFSSSLLSSIRVVSSAYLRLLTFLPAILAPACDSPSLTFHMMYPACKLNKQDDNKKPWWTPFPMLNQSVVLCPVLTVASQETGKVVWYFHLFKNFPQFVVIHIVKGFSIVNETEVDVFLEFLWFFYDPMDVGNLISGFSAFSKPSLYIWKFSVHALLKPKLKDFEYNLASMWNKSNCMVIWTFFGIAFLWDWNENWPVPVLWPLLSLSNLLACWAQHFYSITF